MMLKRAEVTLTVLLLALNCGAGVISFVPPSCLGHLARPSQLIIERSHGCKTKCSTISKAAAQDTSGSPLPGNPLPPKDETFSPRGSLFELLEAPVPPESCGRFDGVGKKTGGIWRSRVLGFMPSTVVAWPLADKWVIQQEAAGNLIPSYPKSLKELFGPKALTSLILPSRRHAALTTAFDCVLSPRAITTLLPAIEAAMDKLVIGWEKAAALGQEITMLDDIKCFTLETICGGLLGDYATETVREEIACLLPVFANGVISIPKRFRWPLNLLPMLRYRQSLDAREGLVRVLQEVVQRRKYDIEHANEDGDGQHAGVVDGFLRIRKEQQEGTQNPDPEVDDDFIVDNVIAALFGGYDTTAAVIARMVQTLGSADGKAIIDELTNELSKAITSNDTLRYGSNGVLSSSIFKSFPLLEAVFLESYRLSPSGPGLFRKVVGETAYNGYRIPAGESIQWNTSIGCRAKSLYPEPERFCPARFLHQGNSKHGTSPDNKKQPHPQPFGIGVHMCRGRELAKLEMLIFFRELLSRFEFDLVKGQSFKGVPPANAPQDKLRIRLKAKAKAKANTYSRNHSNNFEG